MSFRTRLYGSVSRGAGTLHGESPEPSTVHASLDRTFSAKDARKSLTKDEFAKSSRIVFAGPNINIDDEADKYFAFAISRTNRQGCKSIFATLRGAGDSPEEILSGLCGASALSDVDLIRLTSLDCGILKSFLTHEQVVVRSSAASICAPIALRMWEWFISDPTDAGGDLETTQQDIRSWIVQIWRAIADRYADDDDSVAQLSFDYLDQMAASKDILFERVCRHLLSAVSAVATRASSLRSTSALRFATHLLVFALNESRPHELSTNVNGQQVYYTAHCFLLLSLIPSAEGEQNMNGDVCLTSAECALNLCNVLSSLSSYDSGRVKACCANAALSQLRALNSPDLLLPDSCRLSRRRRCARILYQAAEVPTHLPRRQRTRVLGRCAALCATDSGLRGLLSKSTLAIVDVDLNHPQENTIHVLLENERGILRPVWTGPDKPRHRLAVALFEAVLAKYPPQNATLSQRKAWSDLSMRMIEASADCLTWGDFSLRNHRAGHAFVDLLCRRLFSSVHVDSNNNKGKYLDLTPSPGLERFIRASIEWRIKSVLNIQVRARLLYVCTRAFCAFPNSPDLNLGKILVDAARHLAVMPDPNVFAASSNPLEAEPLHLGHAVGGLFSLAVAILAHLARQVPSLRNAVAAAYGHLSTLSDDLSLHERQILAERTKELERPKSFAFGLPPVLVSPGQSPNRSPSHPLDSSHWLVESAILSSSNFMLDNHNNPNAFRLPIVEKQLSGGNDPLYVVGVVEQSESDETRLVATLRMINISNLKIRLLQVDTACRGNVKVEDGYEHSRRIERDVDPGETVILKLALTAMKEESANSYFAGRRGVDIKIGFFDDIRYSLAPWTFFPLLFLEPLKADWDAFRFLWAQCHVGSTTKCECTVNCTEEELWTALEACQNWMSIVVKSQRMVALSAQTCDNKARTLICGFISRNEAGGLTIAFEFRSPSKSLFVGFDSREFIVEALLPGLPVRALWSNSTTWPGAIASSGRAEQGDEFVAPDSVWAASAGEVNGDPSSGSPSIDVMTASVAKWQQLQQQRGRN